MVANPAVEPTDKSRPFTVSEIVTPNAISVTIEIERKISLMFPGVKKLGEAIEKRW